MNEGWKVIFVWFVFDRDFDSIFFYYGKFVVFLMKFDLFFIKWLIMILICCGVFVFWWWIDYVVRDLFMSVVVSFSEFKKIKKLMC